MMKKMNHDDVLKVSGGVGILDDFLIIKQPQ